MINIWTQTVGEDGGSRSPAAVYVAQQVRTTGPNPVCQTIVKPSPPVWAQISRISIDLADQPSLVVSFVNISTRLFF